MKSEDQIRSAVYRAIARVFNHPLEDITDQTCAVDVAGWDSLSNAFVIIDIEEELGTELPLDKVVAANDVGDMIAIIHANLVEKGGLDT